MSKKEAIDIMKLGVDRAMNTSEKGIGGPFGAVIVKEEEIVAVASNTVLESHDPTAHAEVNAIREATKKLGTHDLSDCTIYATSEPCPMCRSAIIWANIKTCIYGNSAAETANIGFRDDYMYDYFKAGCNDEEVLKVKKLDSDDCRELLNSYAEMERELY
ncbi:guanine deaminase [Lachnospiraceae bacterium XBB1006]|nr:guanine deaminase [Lachnospiraceae bacterium XBB1006]